MRACLGVVVGTAALAACAGAHRGRTAEPAPRRAPVLMEQTSGVTVVLQAVSAVSGQVAWVAGHAGVVLRTTDGGARWERLRVPGADSLEFRDVEAFDADLAYLLAAGPGDRSRIFKTADGGRTWAQQFVNGEPRAFYDCFAFFDRDRGVVVSDAVDGRLLLRTTRDGGAHWDAVPPAGIPPAREGEGAFAASGTCLVALGDHLAWIATGSPAEARVYRSGDAGRTWTVRAVPVTSGEAAGATSLAFRDPRHGVALGGRIAVASDTANRVAVTTDGGFTWTRGGRPPFPGAVFGSAYVPITRAAPLVAAGPGGLAISRDDGATWEGLSTDAYWAVAFGAAGTGWAVGPRGRITLIYLR